MTRSNKSQKNDHRAEVCAPAQASRKKQDRGLPDEAARLELARTYLTLQRRLWPDLVRTKVLPPVTTKAVSELADQFRDLFLGDGPPVTYPTESKLWKQLGAAYLRYSDDNSNPRSLDQQLRNVLERAAREGTFIPWSYVFADAAVTGTTAARRGYQLVKAAVELRDGGPHDFYVDDTGRASRDAIEVLTLGRLIRAHEKRLVGVTDGFDSDEDFSKMKLQIFAMVQEWFIDQLRAKVLRGMADGFLRGKNLGRAPVGYKLVDRTDTHGHPILDDDSRPEKQKAIDEVGAEYVREAFRLFAVERLSRERIARRFNELEVGGQRSWDATRVKNLLTRETYVGVECYGMTRHVRDSETGAITTLRKPRSQWKRRDVPHLRIVPDDLWQKAQARLKESREAYQRRRGDGKDGPTRTSVYPTVLIRPVCGYCGCELILGRSGEYESYCCYNGTTGKRGCKLRTYKSVRVVVSAVVNHLKAAVFTPEFVADLVARANNHLRIEAKRPKGNASALRGEIKVLEGKRDRLRQLWEAGDGELDDVAETLKEYKSQLTTLQDRLREAEGPTELPAPITAADIERLVADLHALLEEDKPAVAPILRELTGPVTVTQEKKEEGKRGATWLARFEVNLVPVIARLARQRDCPTSSAWEFLNTRGWKSPCRCEFTVDFVPKYVEHAAEVRRLADGGASLTNIAIVLGETYDTVRNALHYARAGVKPKTKPAGKPTGTRTGPPRYIARAAEIARLRDNEHVPFAHIAEQEKMSEQTVRRAYDYAHREDVQKAAANGRRFARGRSVRIAHDVRCEVRERLDRGESPEFIARAVGCSASTVRRISRERW